MAHCHPYSGCPNSLLPQLFTTACPTTYPPEAPSRRTARLAETVYVIPFKEKKRLSKPGPAACIKITMGLMGLQWWPTARDSG
eukprot:1147780-Pelagomonas_calceolata.AAC.7